MNIKPFQRFSEALQTEKTRQNFTLWLNQFFDYSKTDADGIVQKKKNEIEDLVFNYIIHLKLKIEKGYWTTNNGKKVFRKLSPNSVRPMIAPIKLFFVVNSLLLNWKYLMRVLPKRELTRNQLPWEDKEIQKMLGATTNLRNKAIIHFLASTGCRIGALPDLIFGDLKKIENGAVVWVYNEDLERYRTCLTPEAYQALRDYFSFRADKGYPITTVDGPIFTLKNYQTPITYVSSREVLVKIQKTAGVRGKNASGKPNSKSPNHAFRKRFDTILVNSGVHPTYVGYMMGHKVGQDRSYFKPTDEELWNHFKIAIPLLTIDKSEKLEIKKQLVEEALEKQNEVVKEEIDSLKERNAKLEAGMDEIKDMIRKGYRVNIGKAVYDEYDEMVEIQIDDKSEWEAVERCTKPKHQKGGFDFFPKKNQERKTKRIFTRPNCPNY